jgi:hypothetical protein
VLLGVGPEFKPQYHKKKKKKERKEKISKVRQEPPQNGVWIQNGVQIKNVAV